MVFVLLFSLCVSQRSRVLPLLLIQDATQTKFEMEATEQYFPVVLFIMLYKVVLIFESVNEILKCDHSNESY